MALPASVFGSGWKSTLIPDGDQVQGQVSLDLCGFSYPSEQLRTARRQITLYPASEGVESPRSISNEVVAYRDGGTQQAEAELTAALTQCPTGAVPGAVAGEGEITTKLSRLPADPRWLPGTIAVREVVSTSTGDHEDQICIYQFQGNVMSIVYGSAVAGAPNAVDLTAAAHVADLLRAVPASGSAA